MHAPAQHPCRSDRRGRRSVPSTRKSYGIRSRPTSAPAPRDNRSPAGSGKRVFDSTTLAFSPASPSDPNVAHCLATGSLQDDVATVLPTKEQKDPFCYAQSQEVGQLARGFPPKCRDAIALNRRQRIKAAKTGTKRGFVSLPAGCRQRHCGCQQLLVAVPCCPLNRCALVRIEQVIDGRPGLEKMHGGRPVCCQEERWVVTATNWFPCCMPCWNRLFVCGGQCNSLAQ